MLLVQGEIHRPALFVIAGYSGVVVSFLSVLAYVLRISFDASTASGVVTFSLILLNALAWGIGSGLQLRVSTDPLGRALVILAEALFPLNLYSLSFQYLAPFKGEASLSVSAALSVSLGYQFLRYAYVGSISYPASFYPYFFAGSAGLLIVLSSFTLGLPFADVVWLLLGFSLAFHATFRYLDCQPRAHFSAALLSVLMGGLVLSAITFAERPTVQQLLSFFVGAGILFTLVWSSRDLRPIRQLFGVAWYLALLLSSTETLYFLAAPPAAYVAVAVAWVWGLMAAWYFLRVEEFGPFNDTAYWLSFLLGLGLIVYWLPFWSALAELHLKLPIQRVFRLPPTSGMGLPMAPLAPLSMSAVGIAFLIGGWLKRQYPTITPSTVGLTVHVVSVGLMSYLPPFLFLAAGSGLWAMLSGNMYGAALTPLAIGALYLLLGHALDHLSLTVPLKVSGYFSLLLASVTALSNGSLTLFVLFTSALICLGLSVRGGSFLAHLWFLGAAMGAAGLAAFKVWGQGETLVLSLLYVGLLGVCRWLLTMEGRGAEVLLTFGGAQLLGIGVVGVDLARGPWGSWGVLLIWLGFLGLLGGWEGPHGAGARWWAGLGHGVAHGAGGAWLLSMLRGWGVPTGYEGLALAGWAWGYWGADRVLAERVPGRVGTAAVGWATHAFALLALVLAAFHFMAGWPSLLTYLLVAAFYFTLRLTTGWEPLEHISAGALLGAIALWGLTSQISLPEFYLIPLGVYLSVVLYRKSPQRLVNQGDALASPVFRSEARKGVRRIGETLLPASILLVFLVSPFLALLQSLRPIHAFFLGGGATVSVWLFLLTRQGPILISLVCLLLLLGVIYLLAFGDPDRLVIVFLVVVGHLITANMVFMKKSS